jgi:hypothetical protein
MQAFESIVTQIKLGGVPTEKLTVSLLQQVPIDNLYAEGFGSWDGNLVLLPLWALQHMQVGELLVCIDGTSAKVGTDQIDHDTRGGCIAYGILRSRVPSKKETYNV